MSRLIIVSNKLPYCVKKEHTGYQIDQRVGGFSSGLENFYKKQNSIWIGWSGIESEQLDNEEKKEVKAFMANKNCFPVFLRKDELQYYYYGFSNKTIWPLFHYFTQNTLYRTEYWCSYMAVNQQFAEAIIRNYQEGDRIWIHDYQLMLLPQILRERLPQATIGYFLHIPFPSYELFRLLPWRTEILEGMLGADLIGFHTYDYERHFMSCVRRLLGFESEFNQIKLEKRIVKVDNFPMGIDYEKWNNASLEHQAKTPANRSHFQKDLLNHFLRGKDKKIIVSIDRLDYAKGISDRLKAYEYFLEHNPQYLEKVSLLLFVIPSRTQVSDYKRLKREVDELVGRINGRYGVINWMPVWYFYRNLSFEELVEIYNGADIGLLTPLRDGMNLVSKEFIACKINERGVLILSEMAGSSKEMSEALLVNPNNRVEIAEKIVEAINMDESEQAARLRSIQTRLSVYNEDKWANDFIYALEGVKKLQETELTRKVSSKVLSGISERYIKSNKRILFLDYDGTLSHFTTDPQDAGPDSQLYEILESLTADEKNEIVIISGRDKETLGKWFNTSWNITFIAEHGVWQRLPGRDWRMTEKIKKDWMNIVRPTLQFYVDRTPRTHLEEKNYSLAWHYRDADPDLGTQRSWELKDELKNLVTNLNLEIMDGDKVIEIKYSGINKGRAALNRLGDTSYDFIMALGDDWTDEYTFEALPEKAVTVKVGTKTTKARYYVEDVDQVRRLLSKLKEIYSEV